MAKLPEETTATINSLKQQSLDIVERATAAEYALFELFGETKETVSFLTELKNVTEDAITSFSRLSNLQLRIAEAQPVASYDTLGLLDQLKELDLGFRFGSVVFKKSRLNGTCHD